MTEAIHQMRFTQKNVLITGAAAGVGRHIAQAFAAEGADIAILDFQDAGATIREVNALGRRSEFFRSDVRHEDGVKNAVDGAAEFFPLADVRREWEATPMNRFVEPEEVSAVMLFLCSADASAMTGQAINVTGGFIMTWVRRSPVGPADF